MRSSCTLSGFRAAFSLQVINVDGIADNIDVDTSTGELWLGLHPLPYKVFAYLENPTTTQLPPSQVSNGQLLIETECEYFANEVETSDPP